jgi:hypothetical protein
MKNYKNKKNGQILINNNILIDRGLIVYQLYDNPIDYKNENILVSNTINIDYTILSEPDMNLKDFIDFIAKKTIENAFKEFKQVDSIEDWDYETGSTGAAIKHRVFIPNYLNGIINASYFFLNCSMSYKTDFTKRL